MNSEDQIQAAIARSQSSEDPVLLQRRELAQYIASKYAHASSQAASSQGTVSQDNPLLLNVDASYQIVRTWHKWSSLVTSIAALGLLFLFSKTLAKNEAFLTNILAPAVRSISSVVTVANQDLKHSIILLLSVAIFLLIATFIAQKIVSAFITGRLVGRINLSSNPAETVRTLTDIIKLSGHSGHAERFKFFAQNGTLGVVNSKNAHHLGAILLPFGMAILIVVILLKIT